MPKLTKKKDKSMTDIQEIIRNNLIEIDGDCYQEIIDNLQNLLEIYKKYNPKLKFVDKRGFFNLLSNWSSGIISCIPNDIFNENNESDRKKVVAITKETALILRRIESEITLKNIEDETRGE